MRQLKTGGLARIDLDLKIMKVIQTAIVNDASVIIATPEVVQEIAARLGYDINTLKTLFAEETERKRAREFVKCAEIRQPELIGMCGECKEYTDAYNPCCGATVYAEGSGYNWEDLQAEWEEETGLKWDDTF